MTMEGWSTVSVSAGWKGDGRGVGRAKFSGAGDSAETSARSDFVLRFEVYGG